MGGKQAVDALLNALKTDPEKEVRWGAADSLGFLAVPETVEALMAAFSDPLVNATAIHALAGFKDEQSAQFLLKLLERGSYYNTTAAGVLAKRADTRAIKQLVHALTATASKDERLQHIGNIAGRLIANFQGAGYMALEPLMSHSDLEVRKRAERGISDVAYCANEKSVRRKAFEFLKQYLGTETDPILRSEIEASIQVSAKKNRD